MKNLILIPLVLILASFQSFTNNVKVEKVDKIISSDTIAMDVYSSGCFHSSQGNLVIIKLSKDSFLLTFTNNDKKIVKKTFESSTIKKLANTYKEEMLKTHKGMCTTSTNFVLSSRKDTVSFMYRVCNSKESPTKQFNKVLGIELGVDD